MHQWYSHYLEMGNSIVNHLSYFVCISEFFFYFLWGDGGGGGRHYLAGKFASLPIKQTKQFGKINVTQNKILKLLMLICVPHLRQIKVKIFNWQINGQAPNLN